MAESIETFVAKLRTEGVDAGTKEAERITAAARAEADAIIAAAKAKAEKIVSDGKAEAAAGRERSKTELELAARDAMLKLRDAAARAVEAMLARASAKAVEDPAWLSATLKDLVTLWAEGERAGKDTLAVRVTPETRARLADWALKEAKGVELQGSLKHAGFAWETRGGVVEVTAESITETLRELVSPELQAIVDKAAGRAPRGS